MLEQDWCQPDQVITTDAFLTGLGGWSNIEYFATKILETMQNVEGIDINEIECTGLLIGLKLRASKLQCKKVLLRCDNEVSTTVKKFRQGKK